MRSQRIESVDDGRFLVRNNPYFLQIDAGRCEHVGKMPDILILGAAREKLVANCQHRGPDGLLRIVGHIQTPFSGVS